MTEYIWAATEYSANETSYRIRYMDGRWHVIDRSGQSVKSASILLLAQQWVEATESLTGRTDESLRAIYNSDLNK